MTYVVRRLVPPTNARLVRQRRSSYHSSGSISGSISNFGQEIQLPDLPINTDFAANAFRVLDRYRRRRRRRRGRRPVMT